MKLKGEKRKRHYDEFLKEFLPDRIKIYVEPFGGTFNMSTYLAERPEKLIYNDINDYVFDIVCDVKTHHDYRKVIDDNDSTDTIFYMDPPYYMKEHIYGMTKGDRQFHIDLRNKLKNLKGKCFISYEDNPFIRELYKDAQIEKYQGNTHYLRDEILIIIP